jgi:hypothetical protein
MNPNSYLVDEAHRPIWSFGGTDAWKTLTYRGYDVFLEWFVEPAKTQPILIVKPTRHGPGDGAFGICLGAVGVYLDASGNLTPEAREECMKALPILGKPKLDIEVRNLMAVVHRWLPELILMPPAPRIVRQREANAPVIEVELRDESSGKVQEEIAL